MTTDWPKPEQFVIYYPPFVGTLGKCEVEIAAAMIVRACQVRGSWGPVVPKEMGAAINADKERPEKDPLHALWSCPLVRPNFDKLISLGFAEWTEGEGERKGPMNLTDECIERIRSWAGRPHSRDRT